MKKKDVIKDNRTGRIYFDSGMIRNFETVIDHDMTWDSALAKYPEIIKL
ncbi:MAG TPA: hypothetical protein VFD35_09565 [Pricia sp.]|nr:hypothetical protein [Pricia sp.]